MVQIRVVKSEDDIPAAATRGNAAFVEEFCREARCEE
jgi:hypothetical protein